MLAGARYALPAPFSPLYLTHPHSLFLIQSVRNYDIPTALSVLTSGTYTRLPSIIKEGFDPLATEKLSDEVVLKTLEELDEVLRWRLACVEKVPRGMSKYWIGELAFSGPVGREKARKLMRFVWVGSTADGRATFRVEGMWEASFTYGGGDTDQGEEGEQTGPAAEWYLLSFKFLFRVKDARGGAYYTTHLNQWLRADTSVEQSGATHRRDP